MDNKKMMELKREILVTIARAEELNGNKGVPYPVVKPEKINEYGRETVKEVFAKLFQEKLITDNIRNSIRDVETRKFYLLQNGSQLAEHWRNNDIWKETVETCDKLQNFSDEIVGMVYDELVRKKAITYIHGTSEQ